MVYIAKKLNLSLNISVISGSRIIFEDMTNRNAYLTTEEAADLLRVSVRTIHSLTASHRIPHRRFGRRCLFVPQELEAFLDGAELETVRFRGGGRCVRPKASDL